MVSVNELIGSTVAFADGSLYDHAVGSKPVASGGGRSSRALAGSASGPGRSPAGSDSGHGADEPTSPRSPHMSAASRPM